MIGRLVDRLRPYALPLLVLVVTWIVIASITPSFRGAGSIFAVEVATRSKRLSLVQARPASIALTSVETRRA